MSLDAAQNITENILGNGEEGAINEKKRNLSHPVQTKKPAHTGYDPLRNKAQLWHTLEGLDRYPNYLSRWPHQDMDRLEEALEAKLKEVREQKNSVLERRRGIDAMVYQLRQHDQWRSLFVPPSTWAMVKRDILDPRTCKAIFDSKQFKACDEAPSVQQVIGGEATVQLDAHLLEELMDEELFDVYSLPLLSPKFCHRLQGFAQELLRLAGTEEFEHLHLGRSDLDTVGLSWINDLLFHLVVRPISRHLFQETELDGGDLDFRHGYVAVYQGRPTSARRRLVPHTDDSEVTLNICIGDDFEGGKLNFSGLRGMEGAGGQVLGDFEPKLGTALLHAGRHFHEVTAVTSGYRYAYIMWARSWSSTRAQECPCCWLNRRKDNSCVCGPRWN